MSQSKDEEAGYIVGLTKVLLILVGLEWFVISLLERVNVLGYQIETTIVCLAVLGSLFFIIAMTDMIISVENEVFMFYLLLITIFEFVVFFAFQYFFLLRINPVSLSGVSLNPVSLFFNSTMVFVFNPLMEPNNSASELLVTVNIFAAIAVVLFVLQSMWQLRDLYRKK